MEVTQRAGPSSTLWGPPRDHSWQWLLQLGVFPHLPLYLAPPQPYSQCPGASLTENKTKQPLMFNLCDVYGVGLVAKSCSTLESLMLHLE